MPNNYELKHFDLDKRINGICKGFIFTTDIVMRRPIRKDILIQILIFLKKGMEEA